MARRRAPPGRIRHAKNVGRRPQFPCGVRKGASRPALRAGRFRGPASRPRLPARGFPRSRRAQTAGWGRRQHPAPVLRRRRPGPVRNSVLLGAWTAACPCRTASVPVPSATLIAAPPGAFPARCARSVHRATPRPGEPRRAVRVTAAVSSPRPFPPAVPPSTSASARPRPGAAPRSSCACASRPS